MFQLLAHVVGAGLDLLRVLEQAVASIQHLILRRAELLPFLAVLFHRPSLHAVAHCLVVADDCAELLPLLGAPVEGGAALLHGREPLSPGGVGVGVEAPQSAVLGGKVVREVVQEVRFHRVESACGNAQNATRDTDDVLQLRPAELLQHVVDKPAEQGLVRLPLALDALLDLEPRPFLVQYHAVPQHGRELLHCRVLRVDHLPHVPRSIQHEHQVHVLEDGPGAEDVVGLEQCLVHSNKDAQDSLSNKERENELLQPEVPPRFPVALAGKLLRCEDQPLHVRIVEQSVNVVFGHALLYHLNP
mmetsp:Transcript_97287/g.275276  ORF Transcript_97287/g.275276 Transcript_97287/m.275276 type:complete len:302 (-) Transcript_97287:113-1018(-)